MSDTDEIKLTSGYHRKKAVEALQRAKEIEARHKRVTVPVYSEVNPKIISHYRLAKVESKQSKKDDNRRYKHYSYSHLKTDS